MSETHEKAGCDCWKHPRQVCDICQNVSPLVVTRGGVPCADQKAALEEFKAACGKVSETRELPPMDGEHLAFSLYEPHKFGDVPAWFWVAAQLGDRALYAERQLSEALRERDEKQTLLDQVLPSDDDPLCAKIVNSGTFDPEIQKAREGGTIGDWMRRTHNAERERDEAREALVRAHRCIGFFSSVIKSGEPWTETCQAERDAVLPPHPRRERRND